MWIATSHGEIAEGCLVRAGLYPFIDCLVTQEEVRHPKPHPESLQLVLTLFKMAAGCFLFARRDAFDAVGGFDERFEYGSDIDFSWRLVGAGLRIRSAPGAVVEHDWGSRRRRLRRAYFYGRARARLYAKHRRRLATAWRADPMVLVYPTFLLGLPLTLRFPLYPALLAVPAWRNRADGPLRVLADHLAFGAGVLSQAVRP